MPLPSHPQSPFASATALAYASTKRAPRRYSAARPQAMATGGPFRIARSDQPDPQQGRSSPARRSMASYLAAAGERWLRYTPCRWPMCVASPIWGPLRPRCGRLGSKRPPRCSARPSAMGCSTRSWNASDGSLWSAWTRSATFRSTPRPPLCSSRCRPHGMNGTCTSFAIPFGSPWSDGRFCAIISPALASAFVARPSALVAQWREQRFPKPCVAGSIPAGGTKSVRASGVSRLLLIPIDPGAGIGATEWLPRCRVRPTFAGVEGSSVAPG
jgi:hypothetical protein